ncbi:MAG TPA: RluA family pseudouridine synthase [Myxococcaceae bacterium]|nr:RluA family pseudouridine synthase [Myxococcaceae bacterium]
MKRHAFIVDSSQAGAPLDGFLAARLGWDLSAVRQLISHGSVYVGKHRCKRLDKVVRHPQTVVVVLSEGGRSSLEPSSLELSIPILFEDDALIAINKPAGLNSQPTAAREGESASDWVAAYWGRDPGVVHRLDRQTSGAMIFAKTHRATAKLAQQFKDGTIGKRYLAVAGPGLPPSGKIDLPISKDPSRPGRYRASQATNGLAAVTEFIRLHQASDHCLLALYPRTGRTHQLRAHLTALGAPIAGDTRYGGPSEIGGRPAARALLHARSLRFQHPFSGHWVHLEAELPEDMALFFQSSSTPIPTGRWGSD